MDSGRKLELLRDEWREEVLQIRNVADLRAYAERFPSPLAGQAICEALDFFSESKVVNGKRDGKKIQKHLDLGYGPRLKETLSLFSSMSDRADGRMPGRDIIIAINLYVEKEWPEKHKLTYYEKMMYEKDFGTEDPRGTVYEFLNILLGEIRK